MKSNIFLDGIVVSKLFGQPLRKKDLYVVMPEPERQSLGKTGFYALNLLANMLTGAIINGPQYSGVVRLGQSQENIGR